MRFLIDTNVLVRIHDVAAPLHPFAVTSLERLKEGGHECCIVPQVLYEYWVVATRPIDRNGLGISIPEARIAVTKWMSWFRLLLDERSIFSRWRSLVSAHDVKGKNAHDARLIATMHRHGLTDLLTFNKPDFLRYPGIRVVTPAEIACGASLQ